MHAPQQHLHWPIEVAEEGSNAITHDGNEPICDRDGDIGVADCQMQQAEISGTARTTDGMNGSGWLKAASQSVFASHSGSEYMSFAAVVDRVGNRSRLSVHTVRVYGFKTWRACGH
jgi:hypothetical protein